MNTDYTHEEISRDYELWIDLVDGDTSDDQGDQVGIYENGALLAELRLKNGILQNSHTICDEPNVDDMLYSAIEYSIELGKTIGSVSIDDHVYTWEIA